LLTQGGHFVACNRSDYENALGEVSLRIRLIVGKALRPGRNLRKMVPPRSKQINSPGDPVYDGLLSEIVFPEFFDYSDTDVTARPEV
jgi:hypothetical protein